MNQWNKISKRKKIKMKKSIINKKNTAKEIKSVFFKQAVVGLKLGSADHSVLNYLNFFTKKIPVESSLGMTT